VSSGVGVITTGEVTVVRGNNGVLVALLDVLTIPLTNAGTASVGKDNTSEFTQSSGL
jgi:hypothetical protein